MTFAALLAAVPTLVRADAPPAEARRERMQEVAQRMADELNLTDDQRVKWKAYAEQERAELEAVKADTNGAKEERRAKASEIRKKYRDLRQSILTPEQRVKSEELRERMDKRRGEHGDKPADK